MTEPRIELRLGRWQDVLADVECDAVVTDPPYGKHVHSGHNVAVEHLGAADNIRRKSSRRRIDYDPFNPQDVSEVVSGWSHRCRGWFVVMTDHWSVYDWAATLDETGRYNFPPVPVVMRGMTVRLSGDGPSNWTVWMLVSRPRDREFMSWGTLPGAYTGPPVSGSPVVGAKPLWLMRALIRDYTKPGDLIVDPFTGSGTTLIAARAEGRHCIGAECDPETYRKACERLAKPYTMEMFG